MSHKFSFLNISRHSRICQQLAATVLLGLSGIAAPQEHPTPGPGPGPMIDGSRIALQSPSLVVQVLTYSGTVAEMSPRANRLWDFTPGDLLKQRSADTFYHLGDLDLRYRQTGTKDWTSASTAFHREPVTVVVSNASEFSGDVSSSLPTGTPLKIVRTWAVEGGDLILRFTITNRAATPVELGGLGIPMVFNNMINDRTLDQAYSTCSFYDPYIGEDAGYVQVSPIKGRGPVLLIVPDGHTPFEAWKPILDKRSRATGLGELGNDPSPRWTNFEGSYDWMVHSAAFAEDEWKGVQEWNPATSETLAPGSSTMIGVRFLVAPSMREIEKTLAAHKRPVAVGIPGYVVPQDMEARLFLRYNSPVQTIAAEPAGMLSIHDDGKLRSGLQAYTLRGGTWGRSRLRITYADGTVQSIGYRTIKPEHEAVGDMGHFLFHEQWFTDKNDPFHRAPSVITYDNEAGKQVTQETRAWIAGLGDEGGSGSWVAAAMKESLQPDREEVAKLESFVDGVLWGTLQESAGEHKFGVHKSAFYYDPKALPNFPYDKNLDWTSWTSWNKEVAGDVGRSFNYTHVAAAYWSLYRIARNTDGMATKHPWQWYLDQAYETTLAMRSQAEYYTRFGQMEGTVYLRLLEDLKHEGWDDKAAKIEALMHERAEVWKAQPYPFGSEMAWDSTGQEEVYDWTNYFGYKDKAEVTVDAILAYDPTIPSWGYNGSARRYWDFVYAGKWARVERQLHHYGSGLNAIPLLTEYRAHPDDLYLLRVGYGGVMGPLTNIDQKGFASAAFHSFPDKMAFDPYSGDYGPNFLGHAINTAVYLTHDADMGWLCFGGNLQQHGDSLHFSVLDSSRSRIYLAPVGLWITLDAGHVSSVDFDIATETVRLHLAPGSAEVTKARLRLQQTAPEKKGRTWKIVESASLDAGASVIPLGPTDTVVTLTAKSK